MKKIQLILILFFISISGFSQTVNFPGTMQRTVDGAGFKFKFVGGLGTFAITDSIHAAASGGGSAGVISFNGRNGIVSPQSSDYDPFYPLLVGTYNNPTWINTLAYSKITGVPAFITTETDPTVPAYAKTLTAFSVIKTSTDALYEPIFSKNTGFNKNFGSTAGTVVEGNDSRIVNALSTSTAASTYQTLANLSTDLTPSANKYPNVNAVNSGLSLKANDSDVLHKTGNETKTGNLKLVGETILTSYTGTFIGNSLTDGAPGPSPQSNRFSTLTALWTGVSEVNFGIGSSTMQKGTPLNPIGGTNMQDRLSNIPTKTSTDRYLVFEFGDNDFGYNGGNYDTTGYKSAYRNTLNNAISKGWSAKDIYVLSPSYINSTGFSFYGSINGGNTPTLSRLNDYILATSQIATEFGTNYLNLYSLMQSNGGDALLHTDGLHPNNKGARVIALALSEKINSNQAIFSTEDGFSNKLMSVYNLGAKPSIKLGNYSASAVSAPNSIDMGGDFNSNANDPNAAKLKIVNSSEGVFGLSASAANGLEYFSASNKHRLFGDVSANQYISDGTSSGYNFTDRLNNSKVWTLFSEGGNALLKSNTTNLLTINETNGSVGLAGQLNGTSVDLSGGAKIGGFTKISGISNIVNGDGIEMYWDGTVSTLSSFGRGTSSAYQPMNIRASVISLLEGNVIVGVGVPTKALDVRGEARITGTTNGTAGTDSLVVTSGGVLKKISPTYYSTGGGGGSYVDLNTNQTVDGLKLWKQDVLIDGSTGSGIKQFGFKDADLNTSFDGGFSFDGGYSYLRSGTDKQMVMASYWGSEIVGNTQGATPYAISAATGTANDHSLRVRQVTSNAPIFEVKAASGNNARVLNISSSSGTGDLLFMESSGAVNISNKLSVATAPTNPTDVVRMQDVSLSVTGTTSASTYSIPSTGGIYRFTGTTSTFTLPSVASSIGKMLIIANRGSGTITLNTNTGANELYTAGTLSNTAVINITGTSKLINDGVNWSFY